ncbi:DapH/DapD/GlmU-related protein, partial [Enterobacter cloacae]
INVPIYQQPMNNKRTTIGENCFIGAGAKILAGTTLGKQCIVGANSVVKGDFPDYCVISGIPAKIIKKYDVESKRWLTV